MYLITIDCFVGTWKKLSGYTLQNAMEFCAICKRNEIWLVKYLYLNDVLNQMWKEKFSNQ